MLNMLWTDFCQEEEVLPEALQPDESSEQIGPRKWESGSKDANNGQPGQLYKFPVSKVV